MWDCKSDTFDFKIIVKRSSNYTKREILSQIARFYDPLGLLDPVICRAKIFMQQLCLLKCNWNDKIPHHVAQEWDEFLSSLSLIETFKIPGCILIKDASTIIFLHGFADVSEKAFGASIYLNSK